MTLEPTLITRAKDASKDGTPVILVVLAHDCPDSKAFTETFDRVVPSFGQGLRVMSSTGSHRNRNGNSSELTEALQSFAYDTSPGDKGGIQRGHFPCGAIYMNGEEVSRLPSDALLASMRKKTLADFIQEKTGAAYDLEALNARGDRPLT